MQLLTLVYLVDKDNERICLGLKRRGFGEAYYNGFGGKLEVGETVKEAAVREVYEESLVTISSSDLVQVADVTFVYKDKTLRVPTFFVYEWEDEPQKTEEMEPYWFSFSDIPYHQMWEDDQHWMPRVFRGEKLTGKVWFEADDKTIAKMEWTEVDQFEKT